MKKELKIVAFKDGSIFKESTKNAGRAYVRVATEQNAIRNNQWIVEKRSATLSLDKTTAENLTVGTDLNVMFKSIGLPEMFVQRVATLTPQYPEQTKAINPTTGEEMSYYLSFNVVPVGTQDIDETKAGSSVASPKVTASDFIEE
jgi:hypothetical protein